MPSKIIDAIKKHAPTASLACSIVAGMYQFTVSTNAEIREGFRSLQTEFVYSARQPFYLDKEYALRKQLEKIAKDPEDLKTTDIELMYLLCADEFGEKYIPSLPANRKVNAENACKKLGELYISRTVY